MIDARAGGGKPARIAAGRACHESLYRHPQSRPRRTGPDADGRAIARGLDMANVTVEPPRDPAHGDMATNAAMVLAKPAKAKPRDIAEELAIRLRTDERIAQA